MGTPRSTRPSRARGDVNDTAIPLNLSNVVFLQHAGTISTDRRVAVLPILEQVRNAIVPAAVGTAGPSHDRHASDEMWRKVFQGWNSSMDAGMKPAHTYQSAMARIDPDASKVHFGYMRYDLPASRKQQGKDTGVPLERCHGAPAFLRAHVEFEAGWVTWMARDRYETSPHS